MGQCIGEWVALVGGWVNVLQCGRPSFATVFLKRERDGLPLDVILLSNIENCLQLLFLND